MYGEKLSCIPHSLFMLKLKVTCFRYVDKFGEIYKIKMGSETVVLLNSVGAIKEAFAQMGHSFSDRPHIIFVDYLAKGNGLNLLIY